MSKPALRGACAITGFGRSPSSRAVIGSARTLAGQAMQAALKDAGLSAADIDGLLLNQSALAPAGTLPLQMFDDAGLKDLRLLAQVESKGASVLQMLSYACLAIHGGTASRVLCVFADAPMGEAKGSGASYQNESPITGIPQWEGRYGLFGPVANHALLAQRYLHQFGRHPSIGHYAVACRRWSVLNPLAALRTQLTLDQYQDSRVIADPLRLFDCAFPVNGGAAFVVAGAAAAEHGPRPPVYVHGLGQAHRAVARLPREDNAPSPASLAGEAAYRMAGISASDVTMCQLYDAFSICAVLALEDYGLVDRGEALDLIASGATSPGGRLPVNTGGGHLAEGYLQGMTPLGEAVEQLRGDAGVRQVPRTDVALVTGSGGLLEHHAAAVLSPLRNLH